MRARFLIVAFLLFPLLAGAQELPFQKSFSLELGTGYQPLHMALSPSREVEEALAQKGQRVDKTGAYYPVISLSGIWRTGQRTELGLAAGVSWCHHRVTQYDTFATDPDGRPRYDLTEGTPVGWKESTLIPSLTFRYRHLWNPDSGLVAYSGAGVGIIPTVESGIGPLLPLPELTPIGVRIAGRHFYFFLECTMGPVASIGHGGFGWSF